MEYRYCLTYTLYAHNLRDPAKSFDGNIKLEDFGRGVWKDILKAKKILYCNPRGHTVTLKDKNGSK